jgi:hypothetical protein
MWRYQPGPNDYGTASWACHRGCDAFTHWRIIPEDASQVGLGAGHHWPIFGICLGKYATSLE